MEGVHYPFFPHSPCDGLPNKVISAEAVTVNDFFSLKQQLLSRMFSFLFRGLLTRVCSSTQHFLTKSLGGFSQTKQMQRPADDWNNKITAAETVIVKDPSSQM
ncbi:hypothetical protein CDAR_26711 [Caerostris darwini]|uniref:Uncharacterized protein n=1 Tax=Caerostris darwini TaxID=1538125 RepID=A0AAV4TN64_9ARAC|nr:hypothetical protein CDAR_26711 [Caerostris darwini]